MDLIELIGYIIALIVGIIGTYYAIIAYKKQKPIFKKSYVNIISLGTITPPKLTVAYDATPIQNLSFMTISFWNDGNLRIDKNDVSEMKPIKIQAKPGIRIFDFEIISRTKDENKFELTINDNNSEIECRFDYLSKKDGAKIGLLYSGNSIDDITLTGTIKDVGSPKDITNSHEKRVERVIIGGIFVIGVFIGAISFQIQSIIANYLHIDQGSALANSISFGLFLLSIFIAYLITVIIRVHFNIYEYGIPKKLI